MWYGLSPVRSHLTARTLSEPYPRRTQLPACTINLSSFRTPSSTIVCRAGHIVLRAGAAVDAAAAAEAIRTILAIHRWSSLHTITSTGVRQSCLAEIDASPPWAPVKSCRSQASYRAPNLEGTKNVPASAPPTTMSMSASRRNTTRLPMEQRACTSTFAP